MEVMKEMRLLGCESDLEEDKNRSEFDFIENNILRDKEFAS